VVFASSIWKIRCGFSLRSKPFAPTGFTPLAGENQTFKPKVKGVKSYEMLIFNTWGDLLYEMSSMEDPGWDGKVKGKLGPNGNYVYKGTFTTEDGKKVTRSGVFTLIR
jgi:gliding motility-associated-like protein